MPDQRTLALTRRFQGRIDQIGSRASQRAVAAWLALPGYNDENVAEYTDKVSPTLSAAKAASVAAGAAFYSLLIDARPIRVAAGEVPVDGDPREPFISVWLALKNGRSFDEALEAGRLRANSFARRLAVDASRASADVVMHRQGLRPGGWTRLPETGACDWCQTVAVQTYKTRDAASFGHGGDNHPVCHCTPVPNIT
jgi:hypothetical protein